MRTLTGCALGIVAVALALVLAVVSAIRNPKGESQ